MSRRNWGYNLDPRYMQHLQHRTKGKIKEIASHLETSMSNVVKKKCRGDIRQNRKSAGKWKSEVIYCSSSGPHSQRDLPAPPSLHEVPRMYQSNQTRSSEEFEVYAVTCEPHLHLKALYQCMATCGFRVASVTKCIGVEVRWKG